MERWNFTKIASQKMLLDILEIAIFLKLLHPYLQQILLWRAELVGLLNASLVTSSFYGLSYASSVSLSTCLS